MKKLQLLIDSEDLTQTYVAQKSGINRTTLSKIYNGVREISDNHAHDILTKVLNYKDSEAREMLAQWKIEELAEQAGIELPDGARVDLKGWHKVPFITEVSCGEGVDITDLIEDLNQFTSAPDHMVSDPDKTFAFLAKGDSMIPDVNDGDVVIIEHVKEIIPSRIQLVKIDGKLLLGRVHRTQDGYEIDKSNRSFSSIPVRHGQAFEVCGSMVGRITYENRRY